MDLREPDQIRRLRLKCASRRRTRSVFIGSKTAWSRATALTLARDGAKVLGVVHNLKSARETVDEKEIRRRLYFVNGRPLSLAEGNVCVPKT
jgi:NAD(P)-dependent dehydrogenase (short-subunit alcohol dehydrogenase family)